MLRSNMYGHGPRSRKWQRLILGDAWAAHAMFGALLALDVLMFTPSYRQPFSTTLVHYFIGFVAGLVLARVFTLLGRQFRDRAPTGAWYVGNTLFGLCSAFVVVSLGFGAYSVYDGTLLFIPAAVLVAATWWIVGWSALRLLTL